MSSLLFFDSETTGFSSTKIPLDHEKQPHLVQLGALVVDSVTREIVSSLNVIITPDGWDIPYYVVEVHGIDVEKALKYGIPEEQALRTFLYMQKGCKRIAHNFDFDKEIIEVALARYPQDNNHEWSRPDDDFCTLKAVRGMYDKSNLAAAYRNIVGGEFKHHDALADTTACMEIYFKLVDMGRIVCT